MASVGLLYVGAVLFINGLMLLRVVDMKAAGVFNLFVGGLPPGTRIALHSGFQS